MIFHAFSMKITNIVNKRNVKFLHDCGDCFLFWLNYVEVWECGKVLDLICCVHLDDLLPFRGMFVTHLIFFFFWFYCDWTNDLCRAKCHAWRFVWAKRIKLACQAQKWSSASMHKRLHRLIFFVLFPRVCRALLSSWQYIFNFLSRFHQNLIRFNFWKIFETFLMNY